MFFDINFLNDKLKRSFSRKIAAVSFILKQKPIFSFLGHVLLSAILRSIVSNHCISMEDDLHVHLMWMSTIMTPIVLCCITECLEFVYLCLITFFCFGQGMWSKSFGLFTSSLWGHSCFTTITHHHQKLLGGIGCVYLLWFPSNSVFFSFYQFLLFLYVVVAKKNNNIILVFISVSIAKAANILFWCSSIRLAV